MVYFTLPALDIFQTAAVKSGLRWIKLFGIWLDTFKIPGTALGGYIWITFFSADSSKDSRALNSYSDTLYMV